MPVLCGRTVFEHMPVLLGSNLVNKCLSLVSVVQVDRATLGAVSWKK